MHECDVQTDRQHYSNMCPIAGIAAAFSDAA